MNERIHAAVMTQRGECPYGYNCPCAVVLRGGRNFIVMGHPGFNSPANNAQGYESSGRAIAAIKRYSDTSKPHPHPIVIDLDAFRRDTDPYLKIAAAAICADTNDTQAWTTLDAWFNRCATTSRCDLILTRFDSILKTWAVTITILCAVVFYFTQRYRVLTWFGFLAHLFAAACYYLVWRMMWAWPTNIDVWAAVAFVAVAPFFIAASISLGLVVIEWVAIMVLREIAKEIVFRQAINRMSDAYENTPYYRAQEWRRKRAEKATTVTVLDVSSADTVSSETKETQSAAVEIMQRALEP